MKNLMHCFKLSVWLTAVLAMAVITGCGGGKWDGDSLTPPTEDIVPTVTGTNPSNNVSNVALSTAVNTTFSVAMDADSINAANFTLTAPNNTAVTGDVTYSSNNMTATFVPADNLESSTLYTAKITTGVQSEDGTALASSYSWMFTTLNVDAEPIAVSEMNPENEVSDVCTNKTIRAVFDQPLNADTIESPATSFFLVETENTIEVAGTVSLDSEGTTATFVPASELNANIEYTATVTTEVTDVNGNSLDNDVTWTFTTSDTFCQDTITLGSTLPYGVLSNTGVTLGGGPDSTTGLRIDGDVGIFPAGACIGCDNSTVSGVIEIGTTLASDAMDDLEAAYDEALNRSTNRCTLVDSGVLTTNPSATCGGGADGVFAPGLYWSGTSIEIPVDGTITLDAHNDADAVFIFQSESTIDTIGGNTHILLANGAQAKNVFWVAGSSATIGGTDSNFIGTVMAMIGITVNSGTEMSGRAFARGAEVTVQDGALITVPAE
ncbi:Ig-like domain-containing protein [Marinimicrobium sp. ABcell2]|uniref:Ig-like domain-containing protein n=1 Tax=Marinimicrobium sp. ABcell2 TaxID=3069751 RepID=UPI0027B2E087|nr:Ig-like domain-containing protein [Marinimicrobium sp. ABcell2]MDQ2075903.1 ice-binding family protein [Marinimicrobium sp. ABcell2]